MTVATGPGGLTLTLTPAGRLLCVSDTQAAPLPEGGVASIAAAFAGGAGCGLLHLGVSLAATALPPVWAYWRDFAVRYVTALCTTAGGETIAPPDAPALEALIADAPPMPGAEYLVPEVLVSLWAGIAEAFEGERMASAHGWTRSRSCCLCCARSMPTICSRFRPRSCRHARKSPCRRRCSMPPC